MKYQNSSRPLQRLLRRLIYASIGIAAVASFSAYSRSGPEPGTSPKAGGNMPNVTVVVPYPMGASFAPEGWLAENSSIADRVTVVSATGSSQSLQQVVAGRAILSVVAGTDMIQAIGEGAPLVAVATKKEPVPFMIVSLNSNPITNVKQLEGKTVGVISVGGSTEDMLDIMLAKEKADRASVKRVVVKSSPASLEFIRQGKIAAFIADTDAVTKMQEAKEDVHLLDPNKMIPMPGQVYVTTKKVIETQPEVLRMLLKNLGESFDAVQADGKNGKWEKTLKMLGDLKVDVSNADVVRGQLNVQLAAWLNGKPKVELANKPALWESVVTLMHDAGIVKTAIDYKDVFTNDFVK